MQNGILQRAPADIVAAARRQLQYAFLLQALAEAIKTAAPNAPTPHAWHDYVVTTTVLEELPRVDDFGGIEHMPTSAADPIAESHADVRAQTRPRTLARNPA